MLTSAGTPQPIVARLNKEIVRIMQLPDVKERLATHGYEAVANAPQEFAQMIKTDLAKWQKVVKASGARVD